MATKKDLVEAYSFSRRRLVTAFVSGAPGGREVEPARPGRAVIGGMALAVLLLAGAAVLNIIGSPVELDESKPQLISAKESGADYVLVAAPGSEELQLRPVINITSAMLLLGADVEPLVVPRDKLTGLTPGQPIGILQAPATPPPVEALIASGWTACAGVGPGSGEAGGLKVTVSATPGVVPTPGISFVVRTASGRLYLVAETLRGAPVGGEARAHAYELPDQGDAATQVLAAVAGGSPSQAIDVPDQWVTTFPAGGDLALSTFGLARGDVGRPFRGGPDSGPLSDLEVGDVIEAAGRSYLLSTRSEVILLDDFARLVYLGSVPDGRTPIDAGDTLPSGIEVPESSVLDGARWPEGPTTGQSTGEPCSLLRTSPGAAPYAVMAQAIPGSAASAADVVPGAPVAVVDAGAGALVRSGGWFDEEAPTRLLVDDRGYAYGVASAEEAGRLGYEAVPSQVVPDSWRELFVSGVLLSIEAARCPPTSQPREGSCG
ncbi:type VII secretion protein EccB [Nocardioides sp.]|uniref:type VII secretion protein EccB n=1 Tax=Nocardioides sp. TaxID=35761 RepID=UPI002B27875A|nr:type VII secretion protein EccB [Nocardioides sp.]